MLSNKKAVYYICNKEDGSVWVSHHVWNFIKEKEGVKQAGITFDNQDVLMYEDERQNKYYFVPTVVPICLDYPRLLPEMNEKFSDCDISGMVTWHEGASAPEKVLTIHSLGDVNKGVFGPTSPLYINNLLHAFEKNRQLLALDDFQVVTEATHWSGSIADESNVDLLLEYPVPMVDIEVGSFEADWENMDACQALTNTLFQVFDGEERNMYNILGVGGIHFDPNFAQAAFTTWDNNVFGVSHILANQWLVSGEYEKDYGLEYASRAIDAIDGGIQAIAFHDKMKGHYKDLVRALGEKYNVPILKHQRLRNPETIEW